MGLVHESHLSDVGIAPPNLGSPPLAYHLTIWRAIVGELPRGGLLVPPNGQEQAHHSRVKYPHLIMIKTYGSMLFSVRGLCQYPVWSMLFFLWPPDLLRKLHPSSNSSPPIIANHYARTRLASGGCGRHSEREWGVGGCGGCWGGNLLGVINHACGTLTSGCWWNLIGQERAKWAIQPNTYTSTEVIDLTLKSI